MKLIQICLFVLLMLPWQAHGKGVQLKPHKDELFAYPETLETARNGSYLRVGYNKKRDIYERDEIPLRRVHHRYVDHRVQRSRRVRRYTSPNGTYKYVAVGKHRGGARVTVIWVHGQGGNHLQGVNNWTFGGNFNRLQNLMTKNGGLLVSPSFTDFEDAGTQDIAMLAKLFKERAPKTKLIIACGSMGGGICWRLAKNPQTASMLSGLFILGSHWHDDFLKSPAARSKNRAIPIYFGHGSWDTVFRPETQKAFYDSLLKQNPGYPARFVMFDTGKHGTPIRMVDWRRELNWMLALDR